MNSDINYIIQESLKGDKNYQEILLERLNPLIYKNIYKYYDPSNIITEDLLQEGYIIILQSLKSYDKSKNVHFLQYVKIQLYYFYKNLNKKTIKNTISIEDLKGIGKEIKSSDANQIDAMIKKEENDMLYNCLYKLTTKEQEILHLFYFKQYSIHQISEESNLNHRAVINIKCNALNKLKKMTAKLLFQ